MILATSGAEHSVILVFVPRWKGISVRSEITFRNGEELGKATGRWCQMDYDEALKMCFVDAFVYRFMSSERLFCDTNQLFYIFSSILGVVTYER